MVHWTREWQATSEFLPQELYEQYEKAKDMTLEDEHPRSIGVQYATGEECRNAPRKNEECGSKWKRRLVINVFGDESKV